MRYGLPYKGSKNAIADWIVSTLPKAEIFVDLFCGGGAITHRRKPRATNAAR
jgi:site-specific DNA-adenine methylase